MATWAKIKFFYATMLGSTGSTLTATSTESSGDYDVDYIFNMLETNMWKAANTTAPMYITYDAGSGNTKTADYIAIAGHNIGVDTNAAALVRVEYSSDNFSADINEAFSNVALPDGKAWLKEFTSQTARYWRLRITEGGGGLTVAPFISIMALGEKTELDYATASFDPYAQNVKANVGLSQGGYVTGIHEKYTERSLALRLADADSTLYDKVKAWWDASGLKNFFVAWETANNPTDVFLMRPDPRFNNPLTHGGAYRDITINLKGRKE